MVFFWFTGGAAADVEAAEAAVLTWQDARMADEADEAGVGVGGVGRQVDRYDRYVGAPVRGYEDEEGDGKEFGTRARNRTRARRTARARDPRPPLPSDSSAPTSTPFTSRRSPTPCEVRFVSPLCAATSGAIRYRRGPLRSPVQIIATESFARTGGSSWGAWLVTAR